MKTIGVSSYMSWREDGTLRADERWQLDVLAKELYEHLPNAGRGVFVRIARARGLQEELAESLTKAVAALCAGVAVIPVAGLVPMTMSQILLVVSIAWLSGREMSPKAATELFAALGMNVGASFALRALANALIGAAPGVGTLISAAVAFSGTMAIGAAARAYFIRGEGVEAARRIYERVRKSKHD
jgi:uncharacterized protein (DUF697 family)